MSKDEIINFLIEQLMRNENAWFGLTAGWVVNNPSQAYSRFLENAKENQKNRIEIQKLIKSKEAA